MPFESGIGSYVKARAEVTVYFPVDDRGNEYIRCELCPYYSLNSRKCWLTSEIIPFPNKYVGGSCPLEEVESEDINE